MPLGDKITDFYYTTESGEERYKPSDFNEFIIYEENQVCIRYLVQYRRKWVSANACSQAELLSVDLQGRVSIQQLLSSADSGALLRGNACQLLCLSVCQERQVSDISDFFSYRLTGQGKKKKKKSAVMCITCGSVVIFVCVCMKIPFCWRFLFLGVAQAEISCLFEVAACTGRCTCTVYLTVMFPCLL